MRVSREANKITPNKAGSETGDGHGKGLAYAGVVPVLNVVLAVYLLVRPGARAEPEP